MSPVTAQQGKCVSCGGSFAASDLAQFGDATVCAACQPAWVQKYRQGMTPPVVLDEEFHYAGFWIRAAALLIDFLIVGIVQYAVSVGILFLTPASSEQAVVTDLRALGFLFDIFYYCFFWTHGGATPGKMIFGLKVIDRRGGPVALTQAVRRWFGQILSGLLLGYGFMKAGWMPEKAALHDGLARTRVVYRRL
jgi:uncharacterized RDD family membrane protein YckC